MDSDQVPTRRGFLTGASAVGAMALAGCVTTRLSVSAPNVDDSPVFDSFSVANDVVWGNDAAQVKATLTDAATTDEMVRELSAISSFGSDAWTGMVSGGQTSVSMYLPVGTDLTVHAFNHSAEPVDSQPLRVGGNSFP
ncbi:twin-arginine translocation signal domain-containing protein [Halomarina salina]|uniref:Twin-arginine translocation signal domain-containing protein n=1 Tax=Halomarina salina TaxID=1872699 RepID=A0ABD5RQL5_9EURY|nr:twin-arginine translocation signal domain-containing protein [Halomarina salina]